MKYAIDRYAIGTEKEVSADDFDGQNNIPSRRNRFYCPECGEIVYFRAKGGSNPNHFFHQERTDSTPECDKRVDGRSSLSLSERVGLPIYLTTFLPGSFQINIGFPALGAETLEKAASANYTVEISFGTQYRTVKVDAINFIEDEISLIPVDFIPKNGRNYNIIISGEKTIYGLHRKWSDYADGFDQGGAIFSYEEFSGKKIRRGDSISTHRDYYVVTKYSLPSNPCVIQTRVGNLILGRETYGVYKVNLNIATDDKITFSAISDYFKRYFGVWLLECPPELVPIWPPVIQQDYLIPVSGRTSIVCAISSGNELPNIYVYSDYGVSNKEITHDYNGVKAVDITTGKRPITLSVDRKYVGREVSFLSKHIPDSTYQYEYGIGNEMDEASTYNLDGRTLSSEFSFFSNSKMELFAGTKGKMFRHIPIRKHCTIIPAMMNTEELFLVVESAVIRCIRARDDTKDSIEYEDFVRRFKKIGCSQMVPIPRWADYIIRSLKNTHNNDLFQAVITTVKNGKIPIGVLLLLRAIELEKFKGKLFGKAI